jgi:hypothetical protein
MKNRNLALLLCVAAFLAAQVLGIAHTAEYGSGKHKHFDLTCDIYLSTDQAKSVPPPPLPELFVPVQSVAAFAIPVWVVLQGEKFPAGIPRAPPPFS